MKKLFFILFFLCCFPVVLHADEMEDEIKDLKIDIMRLQQRIDELDNQNIKNLFSDITLKGRIFFHMTENTNNSDLNNAFYSHISRSDKFNFKLDQVRMDFGKKINDKISFSIKIKPSNSSSILHEAYMKYKLSENTAMKIGQIFSVLSLENENSALGDQLAFPSMYYLVGDLFRSKGIGISFSNIYDNYGFFYGVYGNSYNEKFDDLSKLSINFKTYYNPYLDGNNLIHLGFSYYSDFVNYKKDTIPDANADTYTYSVEEFDNFALEFALNYNSFNLKSEFANGYVKPSAKEYNKTFNINNYYVQASFLLTGETMSYSEGSFETVEKILNPVDAGGYGAFEVSFRYSRSDFQDKKSDLIFDYGLYDKYSFAFNWLPIENIKLIMEYSRVRESFVKNCITSAVNNGNKNNYDVFILRCKLFF